MSAVELVSASGLAGPEVDLSWQADALCRETDPEAFFPEKGGDPRPAQRVCAHCPVQLECLSYALAADERFGVWGGTSALERQRMRHAGVAS